MGRHKQLGSLVISTKLNLQGHDEIWTKGQLARDLCPSLVSNAAVDFNVESLHMKWLENRCLGSVEMMMTWRQRGWMRDDDLRESYSTSIATPLHQSWHVPLVLGARDAVSNSLTGNVMGWLAE